jgi:phosphatidylglycerol:prolipoprotein diacylglycerol transferase
VSSVLLEAGPVRIWYYGLAYALGFLGIHLWVLYRRDALGWTFDEAYGFSLRFTLAVLAMGRAFDIAVYEWDYYRDHLPQLLSYWRGGMASHGVLLGGLFGMVWFCRVRGKKLLRTADELVIPGALFMALGRIGNHINGEVYGFVTNHAWGMEFPYAEGTRHPVALYESAKNLLIIPILLLVRSLRGIGTGVVLAHFILWYGLLRVVTDLFRDYDSYWLGIGRGQYFNLLMAAAGFGLVLWFGRGGARANAPARVRDAKRPAGHGGPWRTGLEAAAFYALVLFSLTIPSGWTQDVLETMRTV